VKNVTMGNQQATQIELGWLAGIIDGEGYLGLSVSKKLRIERPSKSVTPGMHIVNTDEQIILKAQTIMDKLGIVTYVRASDHSKYNNDGKVRKYDKIIFTIQVHRYINMIKLLESIGEQLTGNKKKRGKLVLEYCKSRSASYIPGKHSHPFTNRELEIIEECLPLQRRGASETIRKIQLEVSKIYEIQRNRERAESMNHKILVCCDNCGKEFYVSPSYLKGHEHHFCSIICRVVFQGKYGKLYQNPTKQVVKI